MHGMAKGLVAGLLLVWGAASSPAMAADLAVQNLQFVISELGPQRADLAFFAGERLCARWDVVGATPATDGLVDFEVTWQLTNAEDKVQAFNTAFVTRRPWKGSDAFSRINFVFMLPEHLAAGQMVLECTILDKVADKRVRFQQELTIKPAAFGLMSPMFVYDAEGRVAAPLGGSVGQTLHFAMSTVGEDRTQETWDFALEVHLLDLAGEEVVSLARPITVATGDRRVIENPKSHALFRGGIALDQPGSFTLRLVVTDKASGATSQVELPIEILDPSAPATLANRAATTR